MNVIHLVVIAAIGGIAVALQGQLMGIIDKQAGTLESVFVTYGGGGFIIGIIMILLRGGNLSGLFGADIRPISLSRITGMLVMFLGIWMVMR